MGAGNQTAEAHEMFHNIQYLMKQQQSATLTKQHLWWMEATAAHAAGRYYEHVHPGSNGEDHELQYAYDYFNPQLGIEPAYRRSLGQIVGFDSGYSRVTFVHFLAQRFDQQVQGFNIIKSVFSDFTSSQQRAAPGIDNILQQQPSPSHLANEYQRFAVRNLFRDKDNGYQNPPQGWESFDHISYGSNIDIQGKSNSGDITAFNMAIPNNVHYINGYPASINDAEPLGGVGRVSFTMPKLSANYLEFKTPEGIGNETTIQTIAIQNNGPSTVIRAGFVDFEGSSPKSYTNAVSGFQPEAGIIVNVPVQVGIGGAVRLQRVVGQPVHVTRTQVALTNGDMGIDEQSDDPMGNVDVAVVTTPTFRRAFSGERRRYLDGAYNAADSVVGPGEEILIGIQASDRAHILPFTAPVPDIIDEANRNVFAREMDTGDFQTGQHWALGEEAGNYWNYYFHGQLEDYELGNTQFTDKTGPRGGTHWINIAMSDISGMATNTLSVPIYVLNPPYAYGVSVKRENDNVEAYSGLVTLSDNSVNMRGLDTAIANLSGVKFTTTLDFTIEMADNPQPSDIRVRGPNGTTYDAARVTRASDSQGRERRYVANFDLASQNAQSGMYTLLVDAKDSWGERIDADPLTVAHQDQPAGPIMGYEPGPDSSHNV